MKLAKFAFGVVLSSILGALPAYANTSINCRAVDSWDSTTSTGDYCIFTRYLCGGFPFNTSSKVCALCMRPDGSIYNPFVNEPSGCYRGNFPPIPTDPALDPVPQSYSLDGF